MWDELDDDTRGAMSVFDAATELDDADTHIVQSLADGAVIGLLQARAIHRGKIHSS